MRAMSPVNTGHGQWSSRIGLLLAAVGSAAGPGNIRKFPYTVAESGGAAFVAVYLIDALRSAFSGMDKDAAVAAFSGMLADPGPLAGLAHGVDGTDRRRGGAGCA